MTYFDYDKRTVKYLEELKKVIKSIIALSNSMTDKLPDNFIDRKADLTGRLRRLLNKEQKITKAEKFRKRMLERVEEFITCLDYAEICAHNNLAERNLRSSVIMRKITHGSRSDIGVKNHEVLMSLLETAKVKQQNPFEYLQMRMIDPLRRRKSYPLNLRIFHKCIGWLRKNPALMR